MSIDFTQPNAGTVAEEPVLDSKFLAQMNSKMATDLSRAAKRRGISRNALIREICGKFLDDVTES